MKDKILIDFYSPIVFIHPLKILRRPYLRQEMAL